MFIFISISTVKWNDLQEAGKTDIFERASISFLQSFQGIKMKEHFILCIPELC